MKPFILLIAVLAVAQASFAQGSTAAPESQNRAVGFQQVTVEQLKQILASGKSKRGRTVAKRIDSLALKERLSGAALLRCESDVRGKSAKAALMALADKSAFLLPPPAEIPLIGKPDAADQKAMLALTEQYVTKTLHRLPDFYATRVTTTFRRRIVQDSSLNLFGTNTSIVYHRKGKEVTSSEDHRPEYEGLINRGVFGPILSMAILDSGHRNLAWSHWEKGAMGPISVYSYSVTASESHYQVDDQIRAYSGEIAVDASSGAILRLVVETRADQASNLKTADVEVEYGPVQLGGKTYNCPVKSVAFTQDMSLTWLNDVVFKQYHLFRGEYRILPGFRPIQ